LCMQHIDTEVKAICTNIGFGLFRLAIVLSVPLQFTHYEYPFGIFNLILDRRVSLSCCT
jgi:hypothetical protein